MAEINACTVRDVCLDLIPVSLVIADLLAGNADRKQAAQDLDFRHGFFTLEDQSSVNGKTQR